MQELLSKLQCVYESSIDYPTQDLPAEVWDKQEDTYIIKENVLQATVLSCLRLGIIPQITTNRHIHHVQIVERMDEILNYTKRVEGVVDNRTIGTKFFAAKQILGDVVDEINKPIQVSLKGLSYDGPFKFS